MNAEDLFDVVFNDAFVFDGEEPLADPKSIGVRGGRIAAVSDNPLRGRETINARGRWVAPGLVESHIHLFDPQNSTDPETMAKYVRSDLGKSLDVFLAHGFTTIKSVGDPASLPDVYPHAINAPHTAISAPLT